MTAALGDRVTELLGLALGKSLERGKDIKREDEPAWDSVKHVEFIFLLEDEFGVEFSEEAMMEMTSVNAIVAALKQAQDG